MEIKDYVKGICDALSDKKGEDIRVLDISGVTVVADYFIIASAKNPQQMGALMDAADEYMYKNGIQTGRVEGDKNSTWILMDYGDIIVHIFLTDDRLFYDLERIWQDGKEVSVDEL